MKDRSEPTHTAFARQRFGRRRGPWLEIGTARLEENGDVHVLLDRTTIGGFDGYTYLARVGTQPPGAVPERPDEDEAVERLMAEAGDVLKEQMRPAQNPSSTSPKSVS